MGDDTEEACLPSRGTIIRAENGDILRYDSTGMVMVLSDSVIADIARRLPRAPAAASSEWLDPSLLGDVDAWDLRRDGAWYVFHASLPGAQGPRQFRRLAEADNADMEPAIFADGAGPLLGLFSLGGARRATGFDSALSFPWHVLAPADDLGAVGHAGEFQAQPCSLLEPLREATRDAALADVLIARRHDAHKALPLIVARTETDTSASITALAKSEAYANLMVAIASLKAAAERLDRPATLYGLALEFVLEDVESSPDDYVTGVFDLLAQLTANIARAGLRRPPILAVFDCGTQTVNDGPLLRAQWELAWQGQDHGLTYSAPGYMFRQDRFGRPDETALWQMAEMDATALESLHEGEGWFCPTFLLAEREPDPSIIRVRARSMGDLVIDDKDPFGAGVGHGFLLEGASNAPQLISVAVAEDDAQDILLTFDRPPEGTTLRVLYAFGNTPQRSGIDYPQACGAIRDGWSMASRTGDRLHRWALPAVLPVW